jgi:hypothetical protein
VFVCVFVMIIISQLDNVGSDGTDSGRETQMSV